MSVAFVRVDSGVNIRSPGYCDAMVSLAGVAAVILVIVGIVQLLQGQIVLALVLFVAAAVIGPGGYSLLHRR